MSRVFRRPMFRGGSTNMNGIMSGIKDRENYAEGTLADAEAAYKQKLTEKTQSGIDPVAKLLISGGLGALSENRGGGTLANIAMAFKDPSERLFADLENKDAAERAAELKALSFDVDSARTREQRQQALKDIQDKRNFQVSLIKDEREYNKLGLADQRKYDEGIRDEAREYAKLTLEEKREYDDKLIKQGREFELEKLQAEIAGQKEIYQSKLDDSTRAERMKEFREKYDGSEVQASNRTDYEINKLEALANKKFGQNYSGFTGGEFHGPFRDEIKSKNVGKTFYDVTDGKFKKVTRGKGADAEIGYEVIDIDTYTPDASEIEAGGNESYTDEFSSNPSYKYPPKEFNLEPIDPFDPESA